MSKYDGQQNLLVRTLLADGWTLLVFICILIFSSIAFHRACTFSPNESRRYISLYLFFSLSLPLKSFPIIFKCKVNHIDTKLGTELGTALGARLGFKLGFKLGMKRGNEFSFELGTELI